MDSGRPDADSGRGSNSPPAAGAPCVRSTSHPRLRTNACSLPLLPGRHCPARSRPSLTKRNRRAVVAHSPRRRPAHATDFPTIQGASSYDGIDEPCSAPSDPGARSTHVRPEDGPPCSSQRHLRHSPRMVRLRRVRHPVGDALSPALLPQLRRKLRDPRLLRHLRRRHGRPPPRRDRLRRARRQDRPTQRPDVHPGPDGRVIDPDRAAARLRHRRDPGPDPAGHPALPPGLRPRRRSHRRPGPRRRTRPHKPPGPLRRHPRHRLPLAQTSPPSPSPDWPCSSPRRTSPHGAGGSPS